MMKRLSEAIVKNIWLLLFIVAVITSFVAFVSIYNRDLVLTYPDAKSHLFIARRVFFSQTPGLAQLGGTWLPVPHILMFPLIWSKSMYYSGLAGAIPSMVSFTILVTVISLSVHEFTKDYGASVLAGLIVLTNPSLLYLQATPMSELPLLAFSCLSYLFFIRWVRRAALTDLICSALFICIATLTRYDAWFVFVIEGMLVVFVSLLQRCGLKKVESNFFIYVALGGLGLLLWLVYNQLIFGSALNFALGRGSGSWDAARVNTLSSHSAKHNIGLSILIFSWLSVDNAGAILTFALCVGVLYLFFTKKYNWRYKVGALIFLSPYVFNIVALFLGQSVAFSKHIYPYEIYNLRYGTAILPATAFFIGVLAAQSKHFKMLLLSAILIQLYVFQLSPLAIIEDAKIGNSKAEIKVANWISNHPVKGQTLLSTLAHTPLLFDSHIALKRIIYEGDRNLWDNALRSPDFFVERIIMKSSDIINDQVTKSLKDKPVVKEKYNLVYDDGDYRIYNKKTTVKKKIFKH